MTFRTVFAAEKGVCLLCKQNKGARQKVRMQKVLRIVFAELTERRQCYAAVKGMVLS